MKTLAALAFALFATTACATQEPNDGLDLHLAGGTIEGSFAENGVAINFRITEMGQQVAIELETRAGYQRVETLPASLPELELVRHLPHVLAVEGIEIQPAIEATPALEEVFCPTRPSGDPTGQTDSLDLDRN
jgi:hypothetical protein